MKKCLALLKTHTCTGYDVTSKAGIKPAVFKAKPECYLKQFWEEPLSEPTMQQAETYLIQVIIDYKSSCGTFDKLRYKIYILTEK